MVVIFNDNHLKVLEKALEISIRNYFIMEDDLIIISGDGDRVEGTLTIDFPKKSIKIEVFYFNDYLSETKTISFPF